MKLLKSSLIKKLIIILIAIIVFNIAVPKTVNAVDLGGILFKPISTLLLTFLVSVDTSIGLFLTSTDFAINGVGNIINLIIGGLGLGDSIGYEHTEMKINDVGEVVYETVDTVLSDIFIGPDTIFSGKLHMLDANIFKAPTNAILKDGNMIGVFKKGVAVTYMNLRNICGYIMLAALIFTGIRVLVTSNIPTKRRNWLELLQNWFIAMALLIFSHVIMVMVFWLSDMLTSALATNTFGFGGLNFTLVTQCLASWDWAEQIVVLFMLGYMIYLTVVFAVAYMKRLLWVCILIVVAPIMATMYSFGGQGKQIYSKWMREYCMTVLVQPFHMIIYYTLISLPLNMVNSTGGGALGVGVGSSLTAIYALLAMTMIRPAEKYLRNLFGMDQGIANMASFDSGKQTADAIVGAIKGIATKVASTVIAIKTGGASKALGGMFQGMAKQGVANGGKGALGGMLGKGGQGGKGGMLEGIMGEPGKNKGGMLGGNDSGINEALPKNNQDSMSPQQKMLDYDYENMNMRDPNAMREYGYQSNALLNNNNNNQEISEPISAEEFMNRMVDSTGLTAEEFVEQLGFEDVEDFLSDSGYSKEEIDKYKESKKEEKDKALIDGNKKNEKDLNSSNLTITANNVNLQGQINGENKATTEIIKEEDGDKEEETKLEEINSQIEEIDSEIEGIDAQIQAAKERLQESANRMKEYKNAGADEQYANERKDYNKITQDLSGLKQKRDDLSAKKNELTEEKGKLSMEDAFDFIPGFKEKLDAAINQMKLSGLDIELMESGNAIKKGLQSIADTMYVTAPPQHSDFLGENIKNRTEERKKLIQENKNEFVKNEGNKEFIIDAEGLMEKAKQMHPDKSEAYQKDWADAQAEKKLSSLGDKFVEHGITDVRVAYELNKDCKQYGYTPQQAIIQRAGFEKFNVSARSIDDIKGSPIFNTDPEINSVTQVTQVIPEARAREYYNNGFQDVRQMATINTIQERYNIATDRALQIATCLRNKGELRPKENATNNQKQVIAEINNLWKRAEQEAKNKSVQQPSASQTRRTSDNK